MLIGKCHMHVSLQDHYAEPKVECHFVVIGKCHMHITLWENLLCGSSRSRSSTCRTNNQVKNNDPSIKIKAYIFLIEYIPCMFFLSLIFHKFSYKREHII